MGAEAIAWHEFLTAMNQQPTAALSDWLNAWRFGEEGVSLRVDLADKLQAYDQTEPADLAPLSETLH